jgi:diaminohydroxyphosphoribosylaminopyrimidine deaminase / 5-amino-6-(5-phosphoribosylamino)uracil reductase
VTEFDQELMAKAIEVARQGDPSPNPHVGCVIAQVKSTGYKVVAQAHHDQAGGPHAEVAALEAAGAAAEGATVFVTLEPCNHQGRTGPCADTLIRAGVKRVVIGCRDPNPNVSGGGVEKLTRAGIEVSLGVLAEEAGELIEPWTKFITQKVSFLTLKAALSLDGRIATRTGVSKWITSKDSRAYSHNLRARHDAVLVGINTVMADDPRLTVRSTTGRNPIRVVVDSKLRLPVDRKLVQTAHEIPTCVLTTEEADPDHEAVLIDLGLSIIKLPTTAEGRCDMKVALRELAKREVVSVLCEGGAELAGTLLAGHLVDRLHAFVAPILLGPRGRACAVDWAGPETLEAAPRIERPKWELHGDDAHVSGRVVYGIAKSDE